MHPLDCKLFDAHCHHPSGWGEAALHRFVASGFSPSSNHEVMAAIPSCRNGYFSLGLGPQEIQRQEKYPQQNLAIEEVEGQVGQALHSSALKSKLVAIGEVGLDKHWGKTADQRERQFAAFERMVALAGRHSLPLVIHSRDAESECIRQLLAAGAKKVMMHCFGGKLEQAKQCADAGWLISIPPQPNSERKRIIRAIDIDSLVVESDAPYIGKKSEDAMQAAEMIARYRGLGLEQVLDATARNACKFFSVV